MSGQPIRFDDGAGYERMMGLWSRLAGEVFLKWLALPPGLKWIDVGCGNGAFTQLVVERCAPSEVQGIDPSEGQLAFARKRSAARIAEFRQGDAMALPFGDDVFDVATMALVIFFVPEPAKGLAEMLRVVRPGGTVAAYAWDMLGGGFPMEPLRVELEAMDIEPGMRPPSIEASRLDVMGDLWRAARLDAIETRQITVQRTFRDLDDLWETYLLSPSTGAMLKTLTATQSGQLKARLRMRLPADAAGRITYSARANAVKGCVPG